MRRVTILIVAICSFTCSLATLAEPRQHFSLNGDGAIAKLPRKLLLLPLDITVFRAGLGGIAERAEDLTSEQIGYTEQALRGEVATEKGLEFVALPQLDGELRAQLDEHLALYEQVSSAALRHTAGPVTWPNKQEHFDYTLGNGLRFLKSQTGADAALLVTGRGSVPTTSSYALSVVTVAFGVIAIPQEWATGIVAIVDLETGDVLWLDQISRAGSLSSIVTTTMSQYPAPPQATAEK